MKEAGVWKLKDLRFFPTFITDYDQGWSKDARPVPTASATLPPDRPPTSVYGIYPKAHIPPYHYDNIASGAPPNYGSAPGRPSEAAIAAVRAPVRASDSRSRAVPQRGIASLVATAEQQAARTKDYHEIENLVSAYGYYLDKNGWDDLADLFAERGSIELAQRGVYVGRERVRGFCPGIYHYANLGTTDAAFAWTTVAPAAAGGRLPARERAADLARRAERLAAEHAIENLQKIYGYYFDRRLWDEVADLFAADAVRVHRWARRSTKTSS